MPKFVDRVGQKFGKLTVVGRAAGGCLGGKSLWRCDCDCGTRDHIVSNCNLKATKSCGCLREIVNITGQRFGRLVATRLVGTNSRSKALWQCICDCNNICVVEGCLLRSGHTRSCGCLVKENPGPPLKHGYARGGKRHPLYTTWRGMRARCNNPNANQFKDWGGRGIQICERWDDFVVFVDDILTSIGKRPPGKMLDRIDNNGNYAPGNVRWVTPKESAQNRRPPERKVGCSGVKGVRPHKDRWRTVVHHNGKQIHIGVFLTVEEAHNAYLKAVDDIVDDAACEEAFERMRWNNLELEIFFARHAEFMMSAAA